jgi:flagellar motor switch protein FliM
MEAKTPPGAGADSRGTPAPQAYDFRHPERLSPPDRKRIGYLHSDLAKRLEMSLAGLVRDYVEVTAGDLSEIRWSGLVTSLPTPCVVFVFEAPPLEGMGLLRIDPGLAFALVDRLFGGKGEAGDLGRGLTAIEQRAVGRFAAKVLDEVQTLWSRGFQFKVSAPGFISSPDLIETSGVDESVIEAGLKLESGDLSGEFSIAYPRRMFEPAIRGLGPKRDAGTKQPAGEGLAAKVNELSLPITARLAPTMVDMQHLMDLSVGDVLLLDNRVSEDVEVLVGRKPVMAGRPGRRGSRLAVKITRFSEEGGLGR